MELGKILKALNDERETIDHAIVTLEHLAAGRGKRRGRPPLWMKAARERKKSEPKSKPKPRKRGRPVKVARG